MTVLPDSHPEVFGALVHDPPPRRHGGVRSAQLTFGAADGGTWRDGRRREKRLWRAVECVGFGFTIAEPPSRRVETLYVVSPRAAIGGMAKRIMVEERIDTDVSISRSPPPTPERRKEVGESDCPMFRRETPWRRREARRRRE